MDLAVQKMDLFRDAASTGLGTFVSDLREGKTAMDALGDALSRVADRLMDAALQNLITGLLGPAGGLGGGLFPLRASGGPVDTGRAYMVGERGPELFVPPTPGRIVANGQTRAGVTIINNIDASGADMAAIKRLEGALIQSNKSIEQRSLAAIARYQTERA
jgi:hypothetical protein